MGRPLDQGPHRVEDRFPELVPIAEPIPEEGAISPAEEAFERGRRTAGLFLGPAVFVLLLALPLVSVTRRDGGAGGPGISG